MKKRLKIGRFIVIGVIIYFIIVCISQQRTINAYKQEAANTQVQKDDALAEQEELKETKSNINSSEYIEEVAREKLGMYLPNERVYIDISK